MQGLWTGDNDVATFSIAIEQAWPGTTRLQLKKIGEGFSNLALESGDGLVFLVGKNQNAVAARRASTSLLPAIAPHLPVAVPRPVWSIEHADGLPFGTYAYPRLDGRNLETRDIFVNPDSLAEDAGAFLAALHAFPIARARALGVPDQAAFLSDIESAHAEIEPLLRERLTDVEFRVMEAWWREFARKPFLLTRPMALVHGDFWADNLLVDASGAHIIGVIDFADTMLGDVAHDLTLLRDGGEPFMRDCIDAYIRHRGDPGPDLEPRLDRYWELRSAPIFSLRASIRAGDAEEIEDCLVKMRRGPILSPQS